MLFVGKLMPYTRNFQAQAEVRYQRMAKQTRQAEGMTEELKVLDPMTRNRKMNEMAARARGIVMDEWVNR